MKKRRMWIIRLLGGVGLSVLLATNTLAESGYVRGKLTVISEPGETSSVVEYYKNGEKQPLSALSWSDEGRSGKAVSLSGEDEYLLLGYDQFRSKQLSFSAWVNWRGAAAGQAEDSKYGQKLFTMTRDGKEYEFLTVALHAREEANPDENGRIRDGVYMGFQHGDPNPVRIDCWNPAQPGVESYGLPENEWHHIAVVADSKRLKLYIDGQLWFDEMLLLGMAQMYANQFFVGGSVWGEPSLNALLDDVFLYDFALDEQQVKKLAGGADPQDPESTTTPTEPPYFPTQPETTVPSTTAPSSGADVSDNNRWLEATELFGLPRWTVILLGSLLGLFVLLSILMSVYELVRRRKRGN